MNVREIVKAYLEANGFDGLYNPNIVCGCMRDDLIPCDFENGNCEAGYKQTCENCNPEDCEEAQYPHEDKTYFCIGPKRQEENHVV